MAVREFNGTSDELVTGIGAASGMVYGTVATLLKFSTVTSFRDWTMLHDSGGSYAWSPSGLTNFSTLQMDNHGASTSSGINPGTTSWKLIVVRKATGTVIPRFSVYDYTAGTWTHAAGAGTLANSSFPPGVGGQVRFTYQQTADFFGGRVAARALWSNSLPWTADAAGDAALAASGLTTAATSWASNSPTAFWLFNQASTATAVPDVSTAGTAGQVAISGTTVVTGDDPPGFNFSLGSTTPVTATRATTWRIDGRITSTRATTWNAKAMVTGTRATTWRVRTVVSATRSTGWAVAGTKVAVSATRGTTWNVAPGTVPVSASRATTWRTIQTTSGLRVASWRVIMAGSGLTVKFPTYRVPLGKVPPLNRQWLDKPKAIVKYHGEWLEIAVPYNELLRNAEKFYLGGYKYELTAEEVADLPPQYVEAIT